MLASTLIMSRLSGQMPVLLRSQSDSLIVEPGQPHPTIGVREDNHPSFTHWYGQPNRPFTQVAMTVTAMASTTCTLSSKPKVPTLPATRCQGRIGVTI
jgi:hypothetical protein